jgi:hypothetical protein
MDRRRARSFSRIAAVAPAIFQPRGAPAKPGGDQLVHRLALVGGARQRQVRRQNPDLAGAAPRRRQQLGEAGVMGIGDLQSASLSHAGRLSRP